jgi:hypothetical protein
LDFIGKKIDIKAELSKGKQTYAEKFSKPELTSSTKGMFLSSIDLKRKKVE